MPTTTLMPMPKQQYIGILGTPLVGGKVYTYAAGTTNPKATYTDAAGTTPHENPITLNLRGEPPSAIFWSGNYRVDVRDALGNLVYTVDNYNTDPAGLWNLVTNLATAAGSTLIGFIQAGVGAVLRTLQAKAREVVSPEDFGAKGDGVTDDAAAIQAAINSFAQGASCAVRFTPGKTYLTKSTITTNNRSVVIDGNNAILLIGANMTYGLQVIGTNCEVRNLQINRAPAAVVTAGVFITGLQHVLRNVTSRAQTWVLFMLCQDMKESHIENLRVDNDVANKTGIVVQFDYCVNNTVSNSMVGFCAQAFYGSTTGQPVSGYHNEGILFTNVITVYAGKAVNFDNGTFIAISNCCFDFTEIIGVFVSNGTDLMVSNTWIASNVTNGFLGIGTLAGVDGVSLQNITFVRGAAAITGTAGVSLSGPNAQVIGCRFKSGMNGGVVTQASSVVLGNVVTGGGTVINTPAGAALAKLQGSLDISQALTVGGSQGIFPTALAGAASAGGNGAPPAQVAAYGTVNVGGTPYKVAFYNP